MVFLLTSRTLLCAAGVRGLRVILLTSGEEFRLEWEALTIRGVKVVLLFLFDYIRVLFFRTVAIISGAVMLYRSSYIRADPFRSRFCLLVIRFVVRMGLLIISPRLICILLG